MEGGIQGWDRGLEHGLTSSSFLPVLAPRTTLGPGSSQQQAQLLGVGVQAALLTALAQSPPPPLTTAWEQVQSSGWGLVKNPLGPLVRGWTCC